MYHVQIYDIIRTNEVTGSTREYKEMPDDRYTFI